MPSPLVSSQSVATVRQADAATLADWDRTHVWHAFTQMAEYEPLLIERGEGAALFDIDGNRYLDGSASMWCNVHGHHHPRLDRAAREQLEKVAHCTNLGLSNPVTVQLAKRLTEIAPAGLEKVFFSDDGATAIEVALKMAFQFWRQASPAEPTRQRFLSIGEAYHGDTLGTIGVGGVARFGSIFGSLTYDAIRVPSPAVCRQPKGMTPEDACRRSLEQVAAAFEAHRGEIAAVVMEPIVQAAGGILVHPPGFLHGMRELTRAHDILLILDEVAMGFGRTGTMFACEQEDVAPDFLCLAKGLTAGYLPMAATLTTERIWNAFLGTAAERKTFFHGHTYGGNPLAAAVSLESLAIFEDEQLIERMQPSIERLHERVAALADHPHVGDVRTQGMIAAIELVADRSGPTPYDPSEARGMRSCLAARKHGALLRPLGDNVVIMPPLCVTPEEIDTLCNAAEAGINEVCGG
jgi:adenosylmethionine-8-amino-7-oxononanoate aminotransferase